jgi:hypothetical protein
VGRRLHRRTPVRFPDTDALTGFLASFTGFRNDTFVTITWQNSNATLGPPYENAVAQLARGAVEDRSRIVVRGARADEQTGRDDWEVTFDSRLGRAGTWVTITEDSGWLVDTGDTITKSVERFTIPMTLRDRRAGRPLLEPISLSDAVQMAHDERITVKAERIGALSGAISGAILGIIASLIITALTGNPSGP